MVHRAGIVTNVAAACSPDEQFIDVLVGWEGSAYHSRVLRDALTRSSRLRVPSGEIVTDFQSNNVFYYFVFLMRMQLGKL